MQKSKAVVIIVLFLIGFLFVHHYAIHGIFFQFEDVNNHETIILFLLGFLLGYVFARYRKL